MAAWQASAIERAEEGATRRTIDEFVARHRDWLFRLAYRLCHDRSEAEDLAHDAMVKAMQSADRVRQEGEMRAWFSRIVTTRFIDRCRAQRVRHEGIDRARLAMAPSSTVDEIEDQSAKITIEQVRAAVEQLRPLFREPYELREFQHMSYMQIAEALDLPLATVKTRIRRAREELRRILIGRPVADEAS